MEIYNMLCAAREKYIIMHLPNAIEVKAAEHPVKAVTIFSSAQSGYGIAGKAEVVRMFGIELKEGENRVHVHGLSSNIDLDSVRVSGISESVRVFDVVCSHKQSHYPEDGDPLEAIRLLWAKKVYLEQLRKDRSREADMISRYGMSLKGDSITPEQASAFFATIVRNGRENADALRTLNEEIVANDRELARLRDVAAERKGTATGDVVVVLNAKKAGPSDLRLTYLVDGIWKATYDLHATTENGRPSSAVELHFRARVSQSTGEDWANTSLTLSTAVFDPLEQGLPAFKALRVSPVQSVQRPAQKTTISIPERERDMSRSSRSRSRAYRPYAREQPTIIMASSRRRSRSHSRSRSPLRYSEGQIPTYDGYNDYVEDTTRAHTLAIVHDDEDASEDEDLGFASEPATVVSESPLSRTYRVAGNSTIPSDGREHQVLIAVLPFEAQLSYVALPRARTVAYMQCEVKNTSEYRLLPGPVNVFMDDSSVSRTQIQNVDVNDTFECTLGADPSIRLTFARTAKPAQVEGGAFAEPTQTVAYAVTTTIKNVHQFDLPRVLVRDSIPVSDNDKRIRIILRKPANLAEAKEGDEVDVDGAKVSWSKDGLKDGKIEWTAEVKSGEELKLETEFEIRAPADSKWQLKLDS